MKTMTRAGKRSAKIADKRIERAYNATCPGIMIDIMNIGKIFAYGRTQIAQGVDDAALALAIHAYVQTIREN